MSMKSRDARTEPSIRAWLVEQQEQAEEARDSCYDIDYSDVRDFADGRATALQEAINEIDRREAAPTITLDEETIVTWASATFPHATPLSIVSHLVEEVEELRLEISFGIHDDAGSDALDVYKILDEIGDAGLLLVHLASKFDTTLSDCVANKFETASKRTYTFRPELGYAKHVGSAAKGGEAVSTKTKTFDLEALNPGDWVVYSDGFVSESGRVKGVRGNRIYVVFHCGGNWDTFEDYTASCCDRLRLTRKEPASHGTTVAEVVRDAGADERDLADHAKERDDA